MSTAASSPLFTPVDIVIVDQGWFGDRATVCGTGLQAFELCNSSLCLIFLDLSHSAGLLSTVPPVTKTAGSAAEPVGLTIAVSIIALHR